MKLESLQKTLADESTEISLIFSRKIKTNQNFISYRAVINAEIKDKIKSLLCKKIDYIIENNEKISDYNPTGVADGNVETISIDGVVGYDKFEHSVYHPEDSEDLENEADNLTFYTFVIENQQLSTSYKVIRRIRNFKRLYTKGFAGFFKGDELNAISTKIIGIDGDIDMIEIDDQILIFNHVSIERVFFMEDAFSQKTSEMLDLMRAGGYITNFDDFEEACLSNQRIQRTISKMSSENIEWTKALHNFDEVIRTIDMFDLPVEYNQVPKDSLIFEEPSQVMHILRLVRDSYYITTINHNQGTDNKIG